METVHLRNLRKKKKHAKFKAFTVSSAYLIRTLTKQTFYSWLRVHTDVSDVIILLHPVIQHIPYMKQCARLGAGKVVGCCTVCPAATFLSTCHQGQAISINEYVSNARQIWV